MSLRARALGLAIIVTGAGAFASYRYNHASAPAASDFSTARAQADLAALVRGPRPIGSATLAESRKELMARLRQAGLQPEVQSRFVCTARMACGAPENVVARIDGEAGQPPLIIGAHLDSVAASPGAHDDGLGVVVVLEIARLLQARAPLPRPVIVLITDGEEVGLLGAEAFVRAHPDAPGAIGFVNVDGMAGPSALVAHGALSGPLAKAMAAAPRPFATSLESVWASFAGGFADTEVFERVRVPSVVVSGRRDEGRYHNPTDDAASVASVTIADRGAATWALVQAMLQVEAPGPAPDGHVDVFGLVLVHGPNWGWIAAAVLALVLVVAGVRPRLEGRAARAFIGWGAASLVVGGGLLALDLVAHPRGAPFDTVGTVALGGLAGAILPRPLGFDATAMRVALPLLAVAAVVLALMAPAAAPVAIVPVVGAALAALLVTAGRLALRPRRRALSPTAARRTPLGGLHLGSDPADEAPGPWFIWGVAAVLIAGLAAAHHVLVPVPPGTTGRVIAILPRLVLALAVVPAGIAWRRGLARIDGRSSARASALSAAVLALVVAGSAVTSLPAPSVQGASLRLVDRGPGDRSAIAFGAMPEPWASALSFEEEWRPYPWSSGGYLSHRAVVTSSVGPELEVRTSSAGPTATRLYLRSRRGADELRVAIPPRSPVGRVQVGASVVPVVATDGWRVVSIYGAVEGVDVVIDRAGPGVIAVHLADIVSGLPADLARIATRRPAGVLPVNRGDASERWVRVTLEE